MKNKNYYISVSEPWDFESKDGENIIKGNIVNIKSNQCLIFKSKYDLEFGEIKGDVLIFFPRHIGIDLSDLEDKRLVLNGGLLRKKYDEKMSEDELKENSKFVIIGSIVSE